MDQNQRFSFVARAKSFTHAGRGLRVFFKTTHNAWVQVAILVLAILLGIYVEISRTDWLLLIFAAGLVLTTEALNTAFEIDINLTSPDMHPYARDTKDVAAGAVLLASLTAAAIGIGIFGPYIIDLLP